MVVAVYHNDGLLWLRVGKEPGSTTQRLSPGYWLSRIWVNDVFYRHHRFPGLMVNMGAGGIIMSMLVLNNLLPTESGAILSEDRRYRYALWRKWEQQEKRYVLFIGLNPSTADEEEDDNTIRRCKRFAADWGYGAVCMANLFAGRATEPKEMMKLSDPVGYENNSWLLDLARGADLIVCAWGNDGTYMQRDNEVLTLLSEYKLMCLVKNKSGTPKHPLYVKADAKLRPLSDA